MSKLVIFRQHIFSYPFRDLFAQILFKFIVALVHLSDRISMCDTIQYMIRYRQLMRYSALADM